MREWSQKHIEELIKKTKGGKSEGNCITYKSPPFAKTLYIDYWGSTSYVLDPMGINMGNTSKDYRGETVYPVVTPIVGSEYVNSFYPRWRDLYSMIDVVFCHFPLRCNYHKLVNGQEQILQDSQIRNIKNIMFGYCDMSYVDLKNIKNDLVLCGNVTRKATNTMDSILETGAIFDEIPHNLILPIELDKLRGDDNKTKAFSMITLYDNFPTSDYTNKQYLEISDENNYVSINPSFSMHNTANCVFFFTIPKSRQGDFTQWQ